MLKANFCSWLHINKLRSESALKPTRLRKSFRRVNIFKSEDKRVFCAQKKFVRRKFYNFRSEFQTSKLSFSGLLVGVIKQLWSILSIKLSTIKLAIVYYCRIIKDKSLLNLVEMQKKPDKKFQKWKRFCNFTCRDENLQKHNIAFGWKEREK